MRYQRFNKGGRIAKSPFLAKSVLNLNINKLGVTFFKKQPFLNRQLLRNGSFLRKVTFHIVNVKRVVL